MDMSVPTEGSFWRRLFSGEGFTAVSHIYVMEWAAILRDIVARAAHRRCDRGVGPGNVLAELLSRPITRLLAALWGPIVGPLVVDPVFVCSIGNVPLAAVLWNGGISFGGVIAFIYRRPADPADPEHLPEVLRHPDDAGPAGHLLHHHGRGRLPRRNHLRRSRSHPRRDRNAMVMDAGITWNYTTWLNIVFLVLTAVLLIRFVRTGGIPMLRMMGGTRPMPNTPATTIILHEIFIE